MSDEFAMKPTEIAKRLTVDERLERVGLPEGFTPRQATAISKARLSFALSDLAEGHVGKVQAWLDEVASKNPAEAIRLYMELMEFTTPRMKAAQVNVNANADVTPSGQRRLQDMSLDELRVVAEG